MTSEAIEINYSKTKMVRSLVSSAAMTAVFAFDILGMSSSGISALITIICFLGFISFGAATAFRLRQLFTLKGPVVSLTETGFRDDRIAPEEIPWTAIRNIRTASVAWMKYLALEVDPAIEGQLNLTQTIRRFQAANRARGINGLWVTARGLEVDFSMLQRLCADRFAKARVS